MGNVLVILGEDLWSIHLVRIKMVPKVELTNTIWLQHYNMATICGGDW